MKAFYTQHTSSCSFYPIPTHDIYQLALKMLCWRDHSLMLATSFTA